MSGPHTRPPGDNWPASQIETAPGGSTSAKVEIDQSQGKKINDSLPWIAVSCILASIALGFAIPAYVQTRDTRAELLQEIQRSEARVIEDNRAKTTAFTLLDSHYRELKARVDAEDKHHERR